MAPKARLLPLLPLITTFLFVSTNVNSVNSPPPPSCAPFDCGNGLTLSYPFHPQIHLPHSCGYPNLAISCAKNQPILHISNNPYAVQSLNTTDNSITVTYGGESCPIAARAVALDHSDYSPLSYNTGNKLVRFHYNCTVYPPSAAGIKCLQRGAKHSYAFLEGSEPESEWMSHCESSVVAPVIESAVDDLRSGSGNAVELAFKLAWELVDGSCKVCEESGGFCGSSNGGDDRNFVCFCSDGRHSSLSCHVSGEMSQSKTSQLNYVAIGSVIFGGVMLTLTVTVFFIKMKNGVPKYGFNRLPTTSGK
ncbi:LEAF RUST 10 DISEASE-RESISTANCE LOCUS RECEPTOR-LIKE PROTEIN KINASE-like 1.2 [Salvia splendens]|uniref:LEAF RUST 10 DISEASE-RESISTANCE LOCUS RECEPTOR-LIKE PROTEIN KINASE-like 1.2 n=1 Tax=Salvia splendens TaxID=180675 RepID=UPI001C27F1CE|nr:LEAF RUST 10 DISEASE-RESISTANCE LOCUS RECEPTOR-LIKE PROTEIN KINASE-like 1.2 [Salvia splendens]